MDAGIEITFLPEIVEQIWRVLVFCLSASLGGKILFGLFHENEPLGRLSPQRRWAWFGTLVFVVQNILIQLLRFNDSITYVGVPLSTVGLIVFWIAIRKLEEAEGESVGDGSPARRPQSSP